MKLRILFVIGLAFSLVPLAGRAQMSFPNGKTVDLVTTNDMLYLETRLVFNIGKHKADQYRWEKISDSSDSRWFLGSCFNGECRNGLPDTGNFMTTFGLADSLCFLAFHVETNGIDGKAVIKYRVTNRYDSTETADLTINVTYQNPSGININAGNDQSRVAMYPNPARNSTTIVVPPGSLLFTSHRIDIFSMNGRFVMSKELNGRGSKYTLDLSGLKPGMYTVKIPSGGSYTYMHLMVVR
jgi:hypothetical protein